MSSEATIEDIQSLRKEIEAYLYKHRDVLVSYPIEPIQWKEALLQLPSLMKTGKAHFLQDVPISFDGEEHRLKDMLKQLVKPNHEELIIVTPYLIPISGGTFLENIARLSNHTVAHSHYKKYRRRILATGAELYEFRHDPSPPIRDVSDVPPIHSAFISLHIKALVGDRKRCFVGSLNLDPRALEINTENGLYIESAGLCEQLAEQFDALMTPENAWRVYVNEKDRLRWESSSGNVSCQPARSFWQRIADFFFRLLPIEGQL
jgi:putative cardiolipin synthase